MSATWLLDPRRDRHGARRRGSQPVGCDADRSVLPAVRTLAQLAAVGEVIGALRGAGVRPILLKGPVTAALLYDPDEARPFCDIDVLVSPAAFQAASATLGELGFRDRYAGARPTERSAHATTWRRDEGQVQVDLHRSLALIDDAGAAFAAMSRGTRRLLVAGTEVEAPSTGACALMFALHAVQHGRMVAKPLDDLRRAVARLDEAAWREAAALAIELDVTSAFETGLRTVDGGEALVCRLGIVTGPPSVDLCVRLGASSGGATHFVRLARARSPRARVAVLRDALLPSPTLMRRSHGASAGTLSLWMAYARRLRRAPRATRDYRQAAAAASRAASRHADAGR